MNLEDIVTTSTSWFWDQYGKALIDKGIGLLKDKWSKFHWSDAEKKYRVRLSELHSKTRLLGNPKPIAIGDIFADVFVLDKPTAFRRFDIANLNLQELEPEDIQKQGERKNALRLVMNEKRVYILGKPGSGKTTFLKYIVLQACAGKIPKTPVFVSLKELADSGLEIIPFIIKQFEICAFPEPQTFIEHLLDNGNILLLFDGLDEVKEEENQQTQLISTLTTFTQQYPEVQVFLTCRIAATEYTFTQFTYIEIADFDERQIRLFARNWYKDNHDQLANFEEGFWSSEQKGLQKLARTPLLLALICLAFDETLSFPSRRADLYKEAFDALLKKWDASRGIRRDEIYRKLSPGRKEQLLSNLAAQNFEEGEYFISENKICTQISGFLNMLPLFDENEELDPQVVLKAIEAQHGLIVERAKSIYSFSHLTFQEYLTARYIIDNATSGTIEQLINNQMNYSRWREVFLLTASLLDNADYFFETFLNYLARLVKTHEPSNLIFQWANENALKRNNYSALAIRTISLLYVCYSSYDDRLKEAHREVQVILWRLYKSNPDNMKSLDKKIDEIYQRSPNSRTRWEPVDALEKLFLRGLLTEFEITDIYMEFLLQDNQGPNFDLGLGYVECIIKYLNATFLLLDCLDIAAVSNRRGILDRLFLPTTNRV